MNANYAASTMSCSRRILQRLAAAYVQQVLIFLEDEGFCLLCLLSACLSFSKAQGRFHHLLPLHSVAASAKVAFPWSRLRCGMCKEGALRQCSVRTLYNIR